jgi:hypothetical protein
MINIFEIKELKHHLEHHHGETAHVVVEGGVEA